MKNKIPIYMFLSSNYKTFDTFPNSHLTILYHWLNREHFHVISLDLKCPSSSNFQVPNPTCEIT